MDVHPAVAAFGRWEGEVEAGTDRDFLGVVTRHAYFAGTPRFARLPHPVGFVRPPLPERGEILLETIAVLESVLAADGTFTMLELGAGYGRWLAIGAAAARQRGLALQLVGIEGEPTHFRWLVEHLDDNGITAGERRLVEAAVMPSPGRVRYQVGDPDTWYGQGIDPNRPYPEPPPPPPTALQRQLRRLRLLPPPLPRPGPEPGRIEIESVTLSSLLAGLGRVDLIDLDVQGVEADVLAEAAQQLAAQVRRVYIGTHGAAVEQQLRELFGQLGWECRLDYPGGGECETPHGPVRFGDGVQLWVNPRV